MLTIETEKTDYKFMIEALANVLNDDNKLKFLIEKYFSTKNSVINAKVQLKDTINKT